MREDYASNTVAVARLTTRPPREGEEGVQLDVIAFVPGSDEEPFRATLGQASPGGSTTLEIDAVIQAFVLPVAIQSAGPGRQAEAMEAVRRFADLARAVAAEARRQGERE